MMDEEYFKFRVEKDQSDWFNVVIKSLIILVLVVSIILLTIWGYRYLTKPSDDLLAKQAQAKVTKPVTLVQQPVVQKQPVKKERGLKKEELALIIKMVIEQMQKEQQNHPVQKSVKKSEDSELLNSLQNMKVDTTKEIKQKPKKHTKKKIAKLAHKKIKEKVIKKKIVYNAVVINKKEVKSVSDLARLYASINKISRKKKKKILKSAYTKKITKEIIIRKNSMRTIKVRKGDTLSSIALRAYGKSSMYHKIFEANPDLLSNPNNLRVGMTLRVPK